MPKKKNLSKVLVKTMEIYSFITGFQVSLLNLRALRLNTDCLRALEAYEMSRDFQCSSLEQTAE